MGPGFHSPDGSELAVDDRLVAPEARAEIVDGQLHMAPPALEDHAVPHAKLAYVLGAHATASFIVAVDMLTRTSVANDFAPDVSVFPVERTQAGGRQLEHLAFEIVNEQALAVQTTKARELVRRGVRRVFCVVVAKQKILEWSRETDSWAATPVETIDDPCFAHPVPTASILGASADDAVAAALRAKHHPAFDKVRDEGRDEGRAEGRDEGRAEGLRIAIRDVCEALGILVDASRESTLDLLAAPELDALRSSIKKNKRWPE